MVDSTQKHLVLSRKHGEKVIFEVGGEIFTLQVLLLDFERNQTRLSFSASENVGIYREEIYEEIKKRREK